MIITSLATTINTPEKRREIEGKCRRAEAGVHPYRNKNVGEMGPMLIDQSDQRWVYRDLRLKKGGFVLTNITWRWLA